MRFSFRSATAPLALVRAEVSAVCRSPFACEMVAGVGTGEGKCAAPPHDAYSPSPSVPDEASIAAQLGTAPYTLTMFPMASG